MSIFDSLRVYAGKWSLVSSRSFTAEEIAEVDSTEVVPSEYGNSVCFYMKTGGKTYIPLSNDATAALGDSIDLSKAKVLTLAKKGEDNITRIKI